MTNRDNEPPFDISEQLTDIVTTLADLALLDAIRQGSAFRRGDGTPISAHDKQSEIFTRLSRMLARLGEPGRAGMA